jgi:hypothetical protein
VSTYLHDRIQRKLTTLNDERLYQVLDFVEFLATKYAEKPTTAPGLLQQFTDGIEGRLRAGGVAASTVSETMGLLSKAVGVLNGVAQASMTVATDVVTAARTAVDQVGAPVGAPPTTSAASTPAETPSAAPPPATHAATTAPLGTHAAG